MLGLFYLISKLICPVQYAYDRTILILINTKDFKYMYVSYSFALKRLTGFGLNLAFSARHLGTHLS